MNSYAKVFGSATLPELGVRRELASPALPGLEPHRHRAHSTALSGASFTSNRSLHSGVSHRSFTSRRSGHSHRSGARQRRQAANAEDPSRVMRRRVRVFKIGRPSMAIGLRCIDAFRCVTAAAVAAAAAAAAAAIAVAVVVPAAAAVRVCVCHICRLAVHRYISLEAPPFSQRHLPPGFVLPFMNVRELQCEITLGFWDAICQTMVRCTHAAARLS